MTNTQDFFSQLIVRFEKRNNAKGIEILGDVLDRWNSLGDLSEKQASWVVRNAEMHKLALSDELQEAVDCWTKLRHPIQPSPLTTPQVSNSQVCTDLNGSLVKALTSAIQALDNALVQLNSTLDRLDR